MNRKIELRLIALLACGLVTGNAALAQPVITNQPISRTVGRCASVAFTVGATGNLPLSYQWRFNDIGLTAKTNATLNLSNVQVSDAGNYLVVITNAAGSVTSQVATLTVDPASTGYSGIYVFGHSWSDTQITGHPCTTTGSASNYWQGRYCNGSMWPEFLSMSLGLDYVAANNDAVCGAQTADVLNQVIAFSAPPNPELGLYFVWSGAVFVTDNLFDDAIWNARIRSWVNDLTNTVLRLYAKGARAVVVQNWHDLSQSPANVRTLGSNTASQLQFRQRVISLNSALADAMVRIDQSKPDLRLHVVDNFSRLNAVLADPSAFGLTKTFPDAVTDSALADKRLTGPGADYVFWDPRHPTSKVQRLISEWNLEVLTNTAPERLRLRTVGATLELAIQKLRVCREYELQSSTNLVDWTAASTFIASAGTNQLSLPIPAESATFFRLQWR